MARAGVLVHGKLHNVSPDDVDDGFLVLQAPVLQHVLHLNLKSDGARQSQCSENAFTASCRSLRTLGSM